MTTSTTTTTTAAPANAAPAGSATSAAGATANPAAGAMFTALLASIGGSAVVEVAAPSVAADGGELPADLPGTPEEETAETTDASPMATVEVPVLPSIVLVPATAEPALPTGTADLPDPAEPATTPALAAASVAPAAEAVLDAVVAVPVAPVALLAVADAMPEQAAPLPAPEQAAPPPAPEQAAPEVDTDVRHEGTPPRPAEATTDERPAPIPVPVHGATAAAPPVPAAPATPPATTVQQPAEPTVRPIEGKRPERSTEPADAAAPAPATPKADAQPNVAATTATVSNAGEATSGSETTTGTTQIDRERFERLADGLAARLRVSLAGDGARVRMHLTPRELGEVVVRLEVKDGLAHAHLIADNRDASRMLAAAMGDLRTALADRGLRLDTVQVRVSGDAGGPMHGQAHAHDGQPSNGQRRTRAPFAAARLDAATAPETPPTRAETAGTSGVSVLA